MEFRVVFEKHESWPAGELLILFQMYPLARFFDNQPVAFINQLSLAVVDNILWPTTIRPRV